jgi:sec-independent protein translocase protein TatA
MGLLTHWPWIIALVVVLIIFGPGKLPQIGGAVGTAIKEFRKATTELKDEVSRATEHTDADTHTPTLASGAEAPQPVASAAGPAEPKKETSEAPKA